MSPVVAAPPAHHDVPAPPAAPRATSGRKRGRWAWVLGGAALAVIVLFMFRREHAQPPESAPTVAVVRLGRKDLTQSVTVSGEFRPNQQVALHAKVGGFLQSISVDVGDHVKEGQVLAQLDVPELRNDLEKAKASVRASEEEVLRAQAAYNEAHISFTRLKEVVSQHPKLVAAQDLDVLQAKDAASSGAVAVARSVVEERRAEADRVQALVGYSVITAPFAGVITRRSFDPGALIQAGSAAGAPLVELVEDAHLRLIFPAPESLVPSIKVGTQVRITAAALETPLVRPVSRFAGKIDRATRTMITEVDLENDGGRLTPGMYATASVPVRESKGALAIPVAAITRGEPPSALVVGPDGAVEKRALKLGMETADEAEVLAGVQPGDLVLVGARSGIRAGQKVVAKVMQAE